MTQLNEDHSSFGSYDVATVDSSSFWRGESTYSTSCNEVDAIVNEIQERVGPKSLVIVAIVSSELIDKITAACSEYENGQVYVESEDSYASRINTLGHSYGANRARERLAVIFSPVFEACLLNIPAFFTKVELVACEKERKFLGVSGAQRVKELRLDEGSSYCGISMGHWNIRKAHASHELICYTGVTIEIPDDGVLDGEPTPPAFKFQDEKDVEPAVQYITEKMNSQETMLVPESSSTTLPWLALGSGMAAGLVSFAAVAVSKVTMGVHGLYVSCGPLAVGYGAGTVSMLGAAAASATGMGTAVAVGVTAAVYFIPWRKLGSWLLDAFDHFLVFLRSLWNKIKDSLSFLKDMLIAILRALSAGISTLGGLLRNGLSSLLGSSNGRNMMPLRSS